VRSRTGYRQGDHHHAAGHQHPRPVGTDQNGDVVDLRSSFDRTFIAAAACRGMAATWLLTGRPMQPQVEAVPHFG